MRMIPKFDRRPPACGWRLATLGITAPRVTWREGPRYIKALSRYGALLLCFGACLARGQVPNPLHKYLEGGMARIPQEQSVY